MDNMNNSSLPLSDTEIKETGLLVRQLCRAASDTIQAEDRRRLFDMLRGATLYEHHDSHGFSHIVTALRTALTFAEQVEPDRNILLAIILFPFVRQNAVSRESVSTVFGDDVASLLSGLEKVTRFGMRNSAVNQENYRGLLLSLADDIRVIIIMIVHSLVLMRLINLHPDQDWVRTVAFEANCLYAQLAHRLGLYAIKGELEDLSLKYTNREIYTSIARKLNETKRDRDAYIAAFIAPVKKKLTEAGLTFEIKGRTKSISSIWAKIKKQKVDLAHIYDLFAIRVIIDTPLEKEKSDCWLAYSILADMYMANPARMRDWISIPKSNGYESLHATVMGPGSKWVEVQFRTRRMDLVAEKGLAAHWRYKGGKSDTTDRWMNNIRDILETADAGPMQLMKDMKMNLYDKEVFAFTPKGDLFRLPPGGTVLDFAFQIHSGLGCRCAGAIVNGRHEKINYKIKNGDTVEILTSSTQMPKHDWLSIVVSGKAKNKIKQALNENKAREAELGKELLARRFKNRKLEIDEKLMMKIVKKSGYKYVNDFYADIAAEKIDAAKIITLYCDIDNPTQENDTKVSADEFQIERGADAADSTTDVLRIGEHNIRGLNYRMARCCAPVYGDDVFGFISADGVVKIHRTDCPNAPHIRARYPYRLIKVEWSGEGKDLMGATIKVLGNDDIGIVTNITSIISKEPGMQLRNISIDSHDGLFQGYLVVGVSDNRQLSKIMRKIGTVKGVKQVTRS